MAFLDETGLAELWGRICTKHDGFVNEHIWAKMADGKIAYVKESDTSTNITIDSAVTGYYVQASYSVGVENNEVVLLNPVSTELNNMTGKYIKHSGVVCRVIRAVSGEGTKSVWEVKTQSVSYAPGVVGYVSSPDSNACPPAENDGFTYKYLGQVGDKANVQTGSYTGTGKFYSDGSNYKNSLTFSFAPKLLVVQHSYNAAYTMVAINGTTAVITLLGDTSRKASAAWSGNSVTWYSGQNTDYQLNDNGVVYSYIAIG